jgi:hypothetical protein
MPIIETRPSLSLSEDDLSLTIAIRNTGHGVAFVESAELLYNDVAVDRYKDLFATILRPDLKDGAEFSWASMTGFLQPRESKDVIRFGWPDTEENRRKLASFFNEEIPAKTEQVQLKLCYCSVFGDCWEQAQLGSARPAEVRACSPGDDPSEALWRTRFEEQDT